MIDINIIRKNPELVRENIRKKFQDKKLPLVDEIISLDEEVKKIKVDGDNLREKRNKTSNEIGLLMREGKKEDAENDKKIVIEINSKLESIEKREEELTSKLKEKMMLIPNIIADDVPIGEDDSKNVSEEQFGEPVVPDFEIPYHADIMASFNGLDKDAAGRVSGTGFYYLMGDIARLHSAVLSYARDFMIDKGFTYCIPPYMIHGDAVNGVMSFEEKENMMYKIEGEDLYLIGTSEHSMIAKYKDQILKESDLPITMTSYSPCFRKEIGAHGIEERGIYRIHQFEKQEMIVICKKEDSDAWYDKMWKFSVQLFRSLNIPVRKLVCCSGDLADLKYRSCDIEAWSPRQKKYFEVCSCSNLTDAQARRLGIRYRKENGEKEFVHTLNNTVIAPPRMLIAFLENNLNEDGSVRIMLASNIGNNKFHSKYDSSYTYTYYTNSELKSKIDTWYNNNISPYSSKLASNTNKFCQTSRTAWKTAATTNGNASLTLKENYTPKYDCPTDANGYGKLSLNVGLITYDESIYAGGFYNSGVTYGYFMFNKADEKSLWSMSPAGVESGTNYGEVWGISYLGYSDGFYLASEIQTKPVINIKGELYVSGYGTSSDPYVVK